MSQLTYNFDMPIGQPGLKYDIGFDSVLTYRAAENLNFGLGLVQGAAEGDARLPLANVAVVTLSADLIASNSVAVSVNGDAITPVVYASSHAETLEAVATAISLLDDVTATVTAAREITIVGDNVEVVVDSFVVTLGASQATATTVASSNDKFVGISVATQAIEQNLAGDAFYAEKSAVSVLTRGRIYVLAEQDVAVGDPVYLRHTANGAGKDKGQFRKDSDTNKAYLLAGARFIRGASAGSVAVVEINLP